MQPWEKLSEQRRETKVSHVHYNIVSKKVNQEHDLVEGEHCHHTGKPAPLGYLTLKFVPGLHCFT